MFQCDVWSSFSEMLDLTLQFCCRWTFEGKELRLGQFISKYPTDKSLMHVLMLYVSSRFGSVNIGQVSVDLKMFLERCVCSMMFIGITYISDFALHSQIIYIHILYTIICRTNTLSKKRKCMHVSDFNPVPCLRQADVALCTSTQSRHKSIGPWFPKRFLAAKHGSSRVPPVMLPHWLPYWSAQRPWQVVFEALTLALMT